MAEWQRQYGIRSRARKLQVYQVRPMLSHCVFKVHNLQGATTTQTGTIQEYCGDDVVAHHDAVEIEDVGTVGLHIIEVKACAEIHTQRISRHMSHQKCLISCSI